MGLALDAWNGLPGALLAWWMKTVGPQGILDMAAGLSDRAVTATTALGYCDANGVRVFSGTLRGTLVTEWREDGGHPYGSFFIPNGYNQTLAELTDEQKNRISPRSIAIGRLKNALIGNAT